MSDDLKDVVSVVAQVRPDFTLVQTLLCDCKTPLRDVKGFLFCIANQVDEVVDCFLGMPMRHLLLQAVGSNFRLNFKQPI